MKKFVLSIWDFLKKADGYLLLLCLISTLFGIVMISSATNHMAGGSFLFVQTLSLVIGVFLYVVFSVIDVSTITDHWKLLLIFSVLFIASLFPFGVDGGTGNRAWLRFGGIGIQPAEVVKITFNLIMAKLIVLLSSRRDLSHPLNIALLFAFFALMFGLIMVASSDLGSALVYLFMFLVILFFAGVRLYWFILGAGALAAVSPIIWNHFLSANQKNRILAPYDPSIDPTGLGITWQVNQSKIALASGGFFGQGLFKGAQTQSGGISQQQTDFIFAVVGEELGLVGCVAVVLLLTLIIIRCVQVGLRSNDRMGMLVCSGFAAMLTFQILVNVGMCIGVTPVIGLTLPFFSYGGSSIVTLFAAMGIVSGIKMRPKAGRLRAYSL